MTDRTDQLLTLAQQLKTSATDIYKNRFNATPVVPTPESHFLQESTYLHLVFKETAKQLESLKLVSRQSSIFNTQSQRIQQLSDRVDDSIKVSKIKLEELRGLSLNNPTLEAIQDILQQNLFKLTREYKEALGNRTKVLKETEAKRSEISATRSFDYNTRAIPSFMDNQVEQTQEEITYLETRTHDVEQVEKQLSELHGLFTQISMMVHEHQLMIERIDSHADTALMNLEKGRLEVQKYHQSVTSNKNLMIKVFLTFVLFFAFYVVFLL